MVEGLTVPGAPPARDTPEAARRADADPPRAVADSTGAAAADVAAETAAETGAPDAPLAAGPAMAPTEPLGDPPPAPLPEPGASEDGQAATEAAAEAEAETGAGPVPPDFAEDPEAAIVASAQDVRDRAATAWMAQFAPDAPRDAGAAPAPESAAPDRSLAARVGSDVGRGLLESGTQVLGGAVDAYGAMLEGVAAFDEWAGDALGLPKLQLFNAKGEFELDILSAEEGTRARVMLPEVPEAETVTGGLVRGVSQFLTGFAVGGKVLGPVGKLSTGARIGRTTAQSAFADFAAFDAHEARLSDLIETVPALQNPVTAYLAADIEDGELEGRLKNVAEGALSDAVIANLVVALRGVRRARALRSAAGGESYADAAARLARDPELARRVPPDVGALRGADTPVMFRGDDPTLMAETRAWLDSLDGPQAGPRVSETFDDVDTEAAARSLTRRADATLVREAADGAPAAGGTMPEGRAPPPLGLSRVPVGQGEVYLNWNRIDSADDLRAVIQDMADAARPEIDAARRGVRTNADTAAAAGDENAWKALVERRAGEPLNAEKSLAVRRLWASSGAQLTEAARRVEAAPTATNLFAFRRAMALHATVQREVIAARTETARALQQWSIPAGPDELVARQVEDVVGQFGGQDVSAEMARRIAALAESGNAAALDEFARRSVGAVTMDAVFENFINAILSGPTTHLVNIGSNTYMAALGAIERYVAAGIGRVRGTADGVEPGEALAMVLSGVGAIHDGLRYAAQAAWTGQSGYGRQKFLETAYTRAISTEALANTRSTAWNRAVQAPGIAHAINAFGALVGAPTRFLAGQDEFFKTIAYRQELHAQALRQAAREAREGTIAADAVQRRVAELIDAPPGALQVRARDHAQYQTLTNDGGDAVRALNALRKEVPGLRYLLPFINVVQNIMRYATERSPAAPLLPGVRADLAAGGARSDLALARLGLGSWAMLTAFDLTLKGQMTGGGPSDYRETAALRRTGWQPNSIRIGDQYLSLSRLDPLGSQLSVAASMAEMFMNDNTLVDDPWEMGAQAVAAVGQTLMDRTYLTGFSDLVMALSEPDRRAERFFSRLAASQIPYSSLLRQTEAALDPELRDDRGIGDTIRSRIPGLSSSVPVRHDLWGRPISFRSSMGSVYDGMSPFYVSDYAPEPIDEELQRLGYFPSQPRAQLRVGFPAGQTETFDMSDRADLVQRYIWLSGNTPASAIPASRTVRGNPDARMRRAEALGDRTLLQALNALVAGDLDPALDVLVPGGADGLDSYADLPPHRREDVIGTVIGVYRDAARDRLVAENPDFFMQGAGTP